MKLSKRSRNYALITYLPESLFSCVLEKNKMVRHYAYILHDKDKNADGELKEKHHHVLINLNNAMTLSAVRAMFPQIVNGETVNTLGQSIYDKERSFVYLTHEDEEDESKYIYPEESIKSDDISYWKSKSYLDDKTDVTLSIIDDIMKGVKLYDLACRYGREIIIYYDKYRYFAEQCKDELRDEERRERWEKETMERRSRDKRLVQVDLDDDELPF